MKKGIELMNFQYQTPLTKSDKTIISAICFDDDTSTPDESDIETWEEKGEAVDAPKVSEDEGCLAQAKQEDERKAVVDAFLEVFLNKEDKAEKEDDMYAEGRWVTFPCVRMSGRVRKIVGKEEVDFGDGEGAKIRFVCEAPDLKEDSHFKRIYADLPKEARKSFPTREEAEESLKKEEAEHNKRALEFLKHFNTEVSGTWINESVVVDYEDIKKCMERLGQVVTQDKATKKPTIFDPHEFDINTWEWGAIGSINKIREKVRQMPDKAVITDAKFKELNKILWDKAAEYAHRHENPHVKWIEDTVWSVPKAFANAFDTLSDGEGVSKEYFLKIFTVEAICALADGQVDSIHEIEDFYNRNHRYWNRDSGVEIGDYVVMKVNQPDAMEVRQVVAFGDNEKTGKPTLRLKTKSGNCVIRDIEQCSPPFKSSTEAQEYANLQEGEERMETIVAQDENNLDIPQDKKQKPALRLPGLDYDALNKSLMAQRQQKPQGESTSNTQQSNTEGKSQVENPDVVTAQEQFKDVEDGEPYVDNTGRKWTWRVVDFTVVPEDVKDEMVDTLSVEEVTGDETPEEKKPLAEDSASQIVMDAVREVLGESPSVVEDGQFSSPRTMTKKRAGWTAASLNEVAPSMIAKNKVSPNSQGGVDVESYLPKAQRHAMENARLSHRRSIASTWDDCKAKDKARCPYHGAAYMRDQLGEAIKRSGLPLGLYGILMNDPEGGVSRDKKAPLSYQIMFTVPEGTTPEVSKQIIKDFLAKNPSVVFAPIESSKMGTQSYSDVDIAVTPEDIDDMPLDAPTEEDYYERHDTDKEKQYNERAKARGAVSWTKFDELSLQEFFDMLSERPTNIVECAEDLLRYATHMPPEALPEGMEVSQIRDLYDRFMEANKTKKGMDAYLAHGVLVDGAKALASAAQKGLEKEYKTYSDLSKQVFDATSDVFNSVQNYLQDKFWEMTQTFKNMPTGLVVSGERSGYTRTAYMGSKYKTRQNIFPMDVRGEIGEKLRDFAIKYVNDWETINMVNPVIQEGCETREPLKVFRGIELQGKLLSQLKDKARMMGELEDAIVEKRDSKWRKKYGVREADKQAEEAQPLKPKAEVAPKEKKAEPSKENSSKEAKPVEKPTAEVKETEEPVETVSSEQRAPTETKSSTKGKRKEDTAKKGLTADPRLYSLTNEQRKACMEEAKKNKSLQALDAKVKQLWRTFGADDKRYKEAEEKSTEAFLKILPQIAKEKGFIKDEEKEEDVETIESNTSAPKKKDVLSDDLFGELAL